MGASCRLDAVAHGGNPQDRAASLLPLAFPSWEGLGVGCLLPK
ncbi:hypothetical protein [Moorena producens]|nr:hypothetical protein [Moorena producens]